MPRASLSLCNIDIWLQHRDKSLSRKNLAGDLTIIRHFKDGEID